MGIDFNLKKSPPQNNIRSAGKIGGSIFMVFFFLIFLCVGSAVGYFFFAKPVMMSREAQNWNEVKCKILHSKVKSHSGSDSTTYSVDIRYSYRIKGEKYTSDRYDFFTGSSSGYQSKSEIVQSYKKGKRAKCYVNPLNPAESVLTKELRTEELLFGIIPLLFIIIGAGGIIGTVISIFRKKRIQTADDDDEYDFKNEYSNSGSSKKTHLSPKSSPLMNIVGVAFFAIMWNGIISIFLYQVYKGFERKEPEWFLTFFMIPFVLVGILSILALIYTILKTSNPKIIIDISPNKLYPGLQAHLKWEIKGKTEKLRNLSIYLEGREIAKYRRGTNTSTATNIFERVTVTSINDTLSMDYGHARFTVPADTVPTFRAANNSIEWYIAVRGEIKWWPDLLEKFPVKILPNEIITIEEA